MADLAAYSDDRTLHRPSAPMGVKRKHPIGASKRAVRADRRILLVAPMRRLRLTSRMALIVHVTSGARGPSALMALPLNYLYISIHVPWIPH